ncbi:MAG TPA: cation:proton antiporter [Actinomycetota bacterium]|nr:cation:proton antiporter [Actinomycetota bacterium]
MGDELIALGGAFLVAGLLARIGRRVGLPTIPFFILAGILTGPNTPGFTLIQEPGALELFAAVGLVLLLFHLGLEFSLGDLVTGGRSLALAGAIQIAIRVGGGILFGLGLGWGVREALVIGGAVGISSSAIATKLLVELRRLANPETGLILGIIVVEDVFVALYLALLQPILGGGEGIGESVILFARAFAFLIALVAVARFGARWVGRLVHSNDDELLTILFIGVAILGAGMAEELGVSGAIGAFMIGMILAETNVKHRVEKLVLPLRDAFAAVFFFAFGLTIDPGDIGTIGSTVAFAVLLTIVLNVLAGSLTARLYRFNRLAAANISLTVLGRGEFSLILATFAAAAGLDPRIGPFVALYVLALAIMGPLFASRSGVLAAWLPAGFFKVGGPPRVARTSADSVLATRLAARRAEDDDAPTLVGRLADRLGRSWEDLKGRWSGGQSGTGRLALPLAIFAGVVALGILGYLLSGFTLGQSLSLAWADVSPADPFVELRGGPRYLALTITALGSIALLAVIVTALSIASEGGLGLSSRRRRMEERIERLSDHYIVCAYGRVGRAAARELEKEGVPFVAIDNKEDVEAQMRKDGVLYIVGDPTSEPVLLQAGIEKARGIVCAVDSDATNVYVTLTARSLNPDIYIVARASSPETPARLQRAGANRVISPYRSSGRQMALLVLRPRVVDSLEVLGRRLEEVAVEPGSHLVGQTVALACGAAVPLLIHRSGGETITHPGPDVLVEEGDRILAWGADADLRPMESSR